MYLNSLTTIILLATVLLTHGLVIPNNDLVQTKPLNESESIIEARNEGIKSIKVLRHWFIGCGPDCLADWSDFIINIFYPRVLQKYNTLEDIGRQMAHDLTGEYFETFLVSHALTNQSHTYGLNVSIEYIQSFLHEVTFQLTFQHGDLVFDVLVFKETNQGVTEFKQGMQISQNPTVKVAFDLPVIQPNETESILEARKSPSSIRITKSQDKAEFDKIIDKFYLPALNQYDNLADIGRHLSAGLTKEYRTSWIITHVITDNPTSFDFLITSFLDIYSPNYQMIINHNNIVIKLAMFTFKKACSY